MAKDMYSVSARALPNGAIGPIVASFVNGPPPDEAFSAKGDGRWKPLVFEYSKAENDKKGHKKTLTASSDQMHFEAHSFGDAVQKGVYRYAVGVVNAKRKRVEVYDAECNGLMFALQPSRSSEADVAAVSAAMEGASGKARRDMLIDAFGSRKKQKMEKSKAANIVDVAAVTAAGSVAADLRDRASAYGRSASTAGGEDEEGAGAGAGGTTEKKVQVGLDAARRAVLPPFNVNASSPDNVYPVDTLLGGESVLEGLATTVNGVMKVLKDAAALGAQIADIARGNAYLRDNLTAVTASTKGGEDDGSALKKNIVRKKVRCLVMLKYLFALAGAGDSLRYVVPKPRPGEAGEGEAEAATAAAMSTEPVIPQLRFVPASVLSYLLSRFTEARVQAGSGDGGAAGAGSTSSSSPLLGMTYVKTPELHSRLHAHIAVFALTVADFSIPDIRPLSAAIKTQPVKLLHSFREAGCNYEPIRGTGVGAGAGGEDDDDMQGAGSGGRPGIVSYSIVLKVPLTFPKPKAGPRRG